MKKPVYRKVNPGAIATDLKGIGNWVVWRGELKGGKWTKPPYDPKTGAAASTDDPKTWADFETALLAYQRGGYDGIGLVLTKDLSLVGFDFDHCTPGGKIQPEVQGFLNRLKTYAEYSPTDGIRALAFGRKPGDRCKLPLKGYEVYETGRYLTITGHPVNGYARIEKRQPEIEAIYRAIFPDNKTSTREKSPLSVDLGDHELLGKAFRSAHGTQIQALYNGDIAGFPSQSEADLAFCNHLAFWTGRDAGRMDRIFRSSGLMREKWDRSAGGQATYGELTIDKAIAGCAKVYEPPAAAQDEMPAPPPEQDRQQAEQNSTADKIKKIINELNRQYAVVMVGGKCRIMREHFDPVFNRPDITFSGIPDFHAYYSNKLFRRSDDEKPVSYSKLWFTSNRRRQYEGIVFTPPTKGKKVNAPPTYYNLWRGFGIKPKKGDWTLFENHIFDNICNANPHHFRWLMSWLARIVQDPGGERPGTAVVLMGRRGTGKGTFASMLRPILEHHYLQLSNQKHLTGNFNSHLKDKLVVFCDEGFWGGSKSDEGVLKALITEPTIPIEAKGQDLIEIKNHVNLIMATNNDWVIPAGLEERRFFVVEVSDKHIQDHQYFKAIWQQMNNGGINALLYDLLEWHDPEVNLREAPKTEALLSQIECTMSPLQKWWYQRLTEGENLDGTGTWYDAIEKRSVYRDYQNYASNLNLRGAALSPKQFGMRLKKIAPSLRNDRETGGARKWIYRFNDLETHRREFQDILRFELSW